MCFVWLTGNSNSSHGQNLYMMPDTDYVLYMDHSHDPQNKEGDSTLKPENQGTKSWRVLPGCST